MVEPSFRAEFERTARLLPRRVVRNRTLPVLRMLGTLLRLRPAGDAEIRRLPSGATVRIFRPARTSGPAPGLLWMHGGGYLFGTAAQDDTACRRFRDQLGATVLSVDYQLAPEHPYPAALDDCHAALDLLRSLPGVDPGRVAIGGASAGGGLAAQLALRVRDRGEPRPVLQLLVYPMLDDRSPAASVDERRFRLWDGASNRLGWASYLGTADPLEAVPARRADLGGVADAWIGVGTDDLFHPENVAYADRLRAAGVACDLLAVPAGYHGFSLVFPRLGVSRWFVGRQVAALGAAFAPR
ncbi:alpha/beta hydrolase [Skermania piniformis]|uniref:Alpha/beta hydrolase n=1 Tax=Skermania pinensis TaxID=39122 RepID=A0ABX8S5W9_9ACTN|nr:alpha/beta hydrolase [Skermania piniformis]QXQ12636.1 alpha/beta hydrolase [Skermania piniformis]